MVAKSETKKFNFSFMRILLMATILVFVIYQMVNSGSNQEDFEKGRAKYTEAQKDFDAARYALAVTNLEESLDLGFDASQGLLGEAHLKLHAYKAAKHYLKAALNVEQAERFVADYYGWVNYNLGMVYYMERNGNVAYKYFKASHDLGYPPAAEYVSMLKVKEDRLPKG